MGLMSSQAPSREYATRPADERFPSVSALVTAAQQERERSKEVTYNLKDLHVVATDVQDGTNDVNDHARGTLKLESPKGSAGFSHWAFGQFSRMLGTPASYLRTLRADIAAAALNYGIAQTPHGETASLLVKAPNGNPLPMVRACTSDSYARVWDAELYGAVQRTIVERDPRWTLPPTWSGESAGAYRGDRDSFLVLVNGGSIVTDPTLRSGSVATVAGPGGGTADASGMYRGILIRNSEVGASSITIESILYRYICGNHMLWGAVMDRQYRRRHVGTKVVRDSIREIADFAFKFAASSGDRDTAIIAQLIRSEIAHTKEAVIDELRKMGATKEQAEGAYRSCETTESASPRSFWGVAQGLTRISQESLYQDERFSLDQIAGKILSLGAKRIAVSA